jgi:peptidoglycan/LPS O-acetylase OafA/YrhL
MNQNTYLSNLTPMRGIAAMLTVIFHIDLMLGNGGNMLLKHDDTMVLSRMYLMVDFFFILSGFIMCHVYGSWFEKSVNKDQFKKFTIARFARVYPLHLVTLMFTVGLFYFSAKAGVPRDEILQVENSIFSFFTNLFLVQSLNFHHWFTWVHASWSISTEWWAYMVFPFLVAPITRATNTGRMAILALCCGGYMFITFYLLPLVTYPPSLPFLRYDPTDLSINVGFQFGIVRCICGFVLGMVMYQLYKGGWMKRFLANGYVMIGLSILMIICMHFAWPDIFVVLLFPLILLSGAYGSKGINDFFGVKPLQKMGDWSFSIYLVHQPLMFLFGAIDSYLRPINASQSMPPKLDMFTGWMIALAFISVILLVSYASYKYIEVPARNRINRK